MPDVKSQEKADRLKAALKENLKRRKVQARGRDETERSGTGEAAEPPVTGEGTES